MEKRFLKIYLNVFFLVSFISSASVMYKWVTSFFDDFISQYIGYIYLLIHLISFAAMIKYGEEFIFVKNNNK